MDISEKLNLNLNIKDKFSKIINIINPSSFFIDYIKVNWQIPYKDLSIENSLKAKRFQNDFYKILKRRILIWKANSPEANGLFVLIDQHYNIQVDFKGSFFINTTKIKNDIINFYKWYLEIDNMVKYYWNELEINENIFSNKYPRATIARLDLATQKNSTFLKNFTPLVSPYNTDVVSQFEIPFKNARYISGITIAPPIGRKTQNIFFRAYDKRFASESAQTCLQRFKSLEFVRKEWMLKSRFLRKNLVTTPTDLVSLCKNPRILSIFIKKIRKSKDLILHNDNNLYKSLHDYKSREAIRKGSELTLKEFNDIYKSKYNIFLNKAKKDDIKKLLYNPFDTQMGYLKYQQNMERAQFIEFQYQMLEKARSDVFDNYDFNNTDEDKDYYEFLTNTIEALKLVKIKKNKIKKITTV